MCAIRWATRPPPSPGTASSGEHVVALCRLGSFRKKGWDWTLKRAEHGTGRTGLQLEASIQGRLWRKTEAHIQVASGGGRGTPREWNPGQGSGHQKDSLISSDGPQLWPPCQPRDESMQATLVSEGDTRAPASHPQQWEARALLNAHGLGEEETCPPTPHSRNFPS